MHNTRYTNHAHLRAALFYAHCGHAGVLRPEIFGAQATAEQFIYVNAANVRYHFSAAALQLSGQLSLRLPRRTPLWILLHLQGPQGELMSWLNLQRLNVSTCAIYMQRPPHRATADTYQHYVVQLQDTDISKYAFVLRRYQEHTWAAFEREVAEAIAVAYPQRHAYWPTAHASLSGHRDRPQHRTNFTGGRVYVAI